MGGGRTIWFNLKGILFLGPKGFWQEVILGGQRDRSPARWLLKIFIPESTTAGPATFTNVNGVLYFTANDPIHGTDFWRSDGTESGTVLVKDIRPGLQGSSPSDLSRIGNRLLFTAVDGIHGQEVWRSNGTSAGTLMVQDIVPGGGGSGPRNYTESGLNVFFVATTPEYGTELWVGAISAALPLSKIDFKGKMKRNDIGLEWISFNEENVSAFEVQRSTDGAIYTSIGRVTAKGRPDFTASYTFTDSNVQQYRSSPLYYRLKIVDTDDAFKYSNIIRIDVEFDHSD